MIGGDPPIHRTYSGMVPEAESRVLRRALDFTDQSRIDQFPAPLRRRMLDPETRAAVTTAAAQRSLEYLEPLSSREAVINLLASNEKDEWFANVKALDWAGLPRPAQTTIRMPESAPSSL
jgi:hypothetical protein